MSIIIKYRPTITCIQRPFLIEVKNRSEAIIVSTCLINYQHFLARENHSQEPYKSRIEFHTTDQGILDDNQKIVDSVNRHKYNEILNTPNIKEHKEALDLGLLAYWFPQVPCNPFFFPIQSAEEGAVILSSLARYDDYLLNECENMRADYANSGNLLMLGMTGNESNTDPWVDWSIETNNDEYYDDIFAYTKEILDRQIIQSI